MSPLKVFDQKGWLSGSTRAAGAIPTEGPPPTSGLRTMVGSWRLPASLWGTAVTPDSIISDSNGTNYAGTVAGKYLFDAAAAGARIIAQVTGGSQSLVKDPITGRFSPSLYISRFTIWKNAVEAVTGGLQQMKDAVANGNFGAVEVIDDFTTANAFSSAATYDEIEAACAGVKAIWPWMPLVARGVNSYLKSTATIGGSTRQYQYLDAGWGQWRADRDGGVSGIGNYLTRELGAGEDCSLGMVGGGNLTDRGTGTVPGWGCQDGGGDGTCSMAPSEIRAIGFAVLDDPRPYGINYWAYSNLAGSTYWELADIQSALSDVHVHSIGRPEGLINIRGDLAAP